MRVERTLFHSIFVAMLAAGLAGCEEKKAAPPPAQAPEVGVITVQPTTVPVKVELPGRTNAFLVAQVRARVDGIVLRREFTEGTDVKAGQRLYKIDPAPFIVALNNAKATLAKAEANLVAQNAQVERFKILVAGKAVAQQTYDNAVATQGQAAADVASGKAAVDTAQINLGYTDVVSPITGRIGISQVTPGALVQAGAATLMTTVQQLDPVYVDMTQSSVAGLKMRRDIQEGRLQIDGASAAKVTLTLEDGRPYPEAGKLQFTDISVDQGTGSVTVRAMFPNKEGVLLPGMFVRATIDEGVNSKALVVPQVGVTHNPKGQAVALVVGPDNKVAQAALITAGTYGSNWIVDDGLKAGDRVIVEGTEKAKPGAVVKPVAAKLPTNGTPAAQGLQGATPAASAPSTQAPAAASAPPATPK